ncbi:MAG: YXWGXW repeat-containing protein [Burkholderiaceae bacterium]|nr:YXWGXW repeat-containing protein [Burkholderiaceae bacterium]
MKALPWILFCALLSGCIVAPAEPDYYGSEMVATAPPAPTAEVIGVAPAPGYVWIEGYWGWTAGRYAWVPGRWEAPRAGYHWVPHQWVHEERGWHLHQGHWEREHRR